MLISLGFLLLYVRHTWGIKVIQTNPNTALQQNGMALIQNSSLSDYDQLTICLRIKTFQFDNFYSNKQAIVTYGDNLFLWSFVGSENCGFPGCVDYYKDLIKENWKYGKVYGIFHKRTEFEFYPSWRVNDWQRFCIRIDRMKNEIEIFNGRKSIFKTIQQNLNLKTFDENIELMNDKSFEDFAPMHGAIADLNVWSRILSAEEIVDWASCKNLNNGDIIDWNTAAVEVKSLEVIDLQKLGKGSIKK